MVIMFTFAIVNRVNIDVNDNNDHILSDEE